MLSIDSAAEIPELITAGPADAETIARIHIASWRAAYANDLPADFLAQQDLGERTELWRNRLLNPGIKVLLAVKDGETLAFCSFGRGKDKDASATSWEIYNLHVSPELRGRGIGYRLFDAAAQEGLEHGATELLLWVVIGNHPARRFYEKHGMMPDGAMHERQLSETAVLKELRYRKSL